MNVKKTNGHETDQVKDLDDEEARSPESRIVDETPSPSPKQGTDAKHERDNEQVGTPVVPVVVLIEDSVNGEGELPGESSPVDDANTIPHAKDSPPVSPADTTATSTAATRTDGEDTAPEIAHARKRKRRRPVRVAPVDERVPHHVQSRLPPNQYEIVLRRRAIRKREGEHGVTIALSSRSSSPSSLASKKSPLTRTKHGGASVDSSKEEKQKSLEAASDDESVEQYDEEYGDISLGLKLNIIGGRVIVQTVKPLDDGRASPAQLTGLIRRGDVLLSVDHASLVNFSLDKLVEGLKPLSSPLPDGTYKRSLHLRFGMGGGLKLLERNEATARKKIDDVGGDGAGDLFSPLSNFMPMVDQLSGQPLFDEAMHHVSTPVKAQRVDSRAVTPLPSTIERQKVLLDPDLEISVHVADQLSLDRQKFTSEFFVWNETHPELLRATSTIQPRGEDVHYIPQSEMIENGVQVMHGAKVVFFSVEDLDVGKDKKSLGRFSSTLSWSSSRRRYGSRMGASIIGSKTPSDAISEGSDESGSEQDEALGDELLLHLAARDEIWRRELLASLAKSAAEINTEKKDADKGSPQSPKQEYVDHAFSLGKMLLGAQVSSMLTTKRKHHSLPPMEVTSVLYDLIARLLDTPDEINIVGGAPTTERRTQLMPFHKTSRIVRDDETLLAACFLVEQALPAWLESFRPLPWEQRRLIWPKTHSSSHAGSSLLDDGLTTLDSESLGDSAYGTKPRKKTIEETIEEKELDTETRAETCYLLTFYFTREILPKIADSPEEQISAVNFVKQYGAYLKLHDCLVAAAVFQARTVVDTLVSLAQFDLAHRDALKELTKPDALVLYDPTMLSAILKKLEGIRVENLLARRRDLVALCAAAYPDLLPWQVRDACVPKSTSSGTSDETNGFQSVYYEYLSLLLHPSEGHQTAQNDCELVQEWCELSIRMNQRADDSRKENFAIVASSKSGARYCRDLPALLKLSMDGKEYELALELINDILDDSKLLSSQDLLVNVRDTLRALGREALIETAGSLKPALDEQRLRQVFYLYDKMSTSKSSQCRESISVAEELHILLMLCSKAKDAKLEYGFIDLLAHKASPADALQTFALWSEEFASPGESVPALHTLIQRGAQFGIKTELSGSLLRVNHARQRRGRSPERRPGGSVERIEGNVWRRMFEGSVPVDK